MTQCRLRDGRIRAGELIGENEPVRNIQRNIQWLLLAGVCVVFIFVYVGVCL